MAGRTFMRSDIRIGRRRLLATGLAAGAAAAGAAVLGPAAIRPGTARAAGSYVAYHDQPGSVHRQRIDELTPLGYRMISLGVYGDPPRYAAVWVSRNGPAFAVEHDLTAAQFGTAFQDYRAQGYLPTLLSATGPRGNPVFAAVFEDETELFAGIPSPTWQVRYGLVDGNDTTTGTLASYHRWARSNDCLPRSVAVYGTGPADRTYAGVWLPRRAWPGAELASWRHHEFGDGSGYRDWFNAYTSVPMRPVYLDANDGLQYAGLFTNESAGAWAAFHGMTSAQYQTRFEEQAALGRMPVSVQGGGTGAGVRLAAVFAESDRPAPRIWTQTGAVGGEHSAVHGVVREFMERYGVRAGALAVRAGEDLVLSSGYTYAEAGYPFTQPDSLFRLASVSKAVTCAAVQKLDDEDLIDLDEPIFPRLGISTVALPGQLKDSRIDSVTIRQCVEHRGGWDQASAPRPAGYDPEFDPAGFNPSGFDPVFHQRGIARLLGLPGRVSMHDLARLMYGEPLQSDPGSREAYSNLGYVLLSLLVEAVVPGMSFEGYVKEQVLKGERDIADQMWVGATLRTGRRPTEVSYDSARVGFSAWDPRSDLRVPAAYGTLPLAAMSGGGGLIASAPAVAAFIQGHAVWGLGGRKPGRARSGSMPGTTSLAASLTTGKDWCVVFNTRDFPGPDNDGTVVSRLQRDLTAVIAEI